MPFLLLKMILRLKTSAVFSQILLRKPDNMLGGNLMNKEKIPAKSQKENGLSDEQGQYIALKGGDFSIFVFVFG